MLWFQSLLDLLTKIKFSYNLLFHIFPDLHVEKTEKIVILTNLKEIFDLDASECK